MEQAQQWRCRHSLASTQHQVISPLFIRLHKPLCRSVGVSGRWRPLGRWAAMFGVLGHRARNTSRNSSTENTLTQSPELPLPPPACPSLLQPAPPAIPLLSQTLARRPAQTYQVSEDRLCEAPLGMEENIEACTEHWVIPLTYKIQLHVIFQDIYSVWHWEVDSMLN